jgi:hypothetical protein
MGISHKFVAAVAAVCALAATPVALGAGGATATATPKTVKAGKSVELLVKGMKANEKIKAVHRSPNGQTNTYFPARRVNAAGTFVVTVKAQLKGKHTWTFTGRTSKRTAKTSYTVT